MTETKLTPQQIEHGPQTYANTGSDSEQRKLFAELQAFNLTDTLERTSDYFKVFEHAGVTYYAPNDECWGCIIAVHHGHGHAVHTGFYDTAVFTYEGSVYVLVPRDGLRGPLVCAFEQAAS